MVALIAIILLVVSPWLIMKLPTPWLALALPIGGVLFYALMNYVANGFITSDPGPAGVVIMGFFGLSFWVNGIALLVRFFDRCEDADDQPQHSVSRCRFSATGGHCRLIG